MTIYQQDCVQWMKTQPDNSINTIVTSPPYNLTGFRSMKLVRRGVWDHDGITYGDFNDDLPEPLYKQQQAEFINECLRVLKPNGSLFYNHKIRMWQRKSSHPMEWILKSNAILHQEIIWDRRNTPALDKRILFPVDERIYWLCKDKPKVTKHNATHTKTIWSIQPEVKTVHPAPFPLELATACLTLVSEPGDLVYDPYCGSGTTLLAAKNLGLNWVGTEMNADYIAIANSRL